MMPYVQELESAEYALDQHRNVAGDSLIVYKVKKAIGHPLRYGRLVAQKRGLVGESAWARTFFGTKLRVPLSDVNAADLYYAGSLRKQSEGYVTRFFLDIIRPGAVFYDVGTNYGFYSSLALTMGAQVHAFEPSPHCLSYLRESFAASNDRARVTLNPIVLSDTPGRVDFFDMSEGHKSGMSTIESSIAQGSGMHYKKRSVEASTLDRYVATNPPPTVMKIDTEGSESKVLKGAHALLRDHSPVIVVELWGGEQDTGNSQEAVSLLMSLGYRSFAIQNDGSTLPVTIDVSRIGENNNFVFKKR